MKDQLHRKLQLNRIPRRIVSLVPSLTELLVDLGLEDAIVGVTKFCVHPKHLRISKAVVGGTKQINVDKVIKLRPDIILCNKEENTEDIIDSLSVLAPIHISDINSLQDCFELITMYGDIFNVKDNAQKIINNINDEREIFQLQFQNEKPIKAAYFIWKNPWMVAASNTFIDTMLNEAGYINVFKDDLRYPIISLENNKLKETDVLLLSSEPFPFADKHVLELKSHFPEKTIQIVDGELFSWYGSRLQQSYSYFLELQNRL